MVRMDQDDVVDGRIDGCYIATADVYLNSSEVE